jgi:hypothetical protein
LASSPLDEAPSQQIAAMKNLTPGDFHMVLCKYSHAPQKQTHEVLITALQAESKHKLEHKRSGFVR